MKKRFILLITVLSATFFLYAKSVEITFEFADGERLVKEYDDMKTALVIWTGDSDNCIPSKELTNIAGLENWEMLQAIEWYGIRYYGDWSFLKDIKNLKGIFVSYFRGKSLRFLEDLSDLEYIELKVSIDKKDSEEFEKEAVDLSKLTKIQKISIRANYFEKNTHSDNRLTRIPNFINVQKLPALDINNNHIKKLTRYDKKLLRQYSKVYLYSNPLSADKEKVEKELKGIEFVW